MAGVLDVTLVMTFLLISRVSHERSLAPATVWQTTWPFLAGLAVGWVMTRSWRNPLTEVSALGVWACTVAGGFLHRYLMRPQPKTADVVVAVLVLGFLLCGWRLMAFLVQSLRRRRAQGLPVD
ncbi:DUF3054 domain-containing protein [Mariniluteicoccus flavus]